MEKFEFKPALIHLILGYGNARFDQGIFKQRGEEDMYARAKKQAAQLLEQIEAKLKQLREPSDVSS